MSCAHPTAQYGQTPGTALASLILSEAAAASTGVRSIPPPTTAVPVAAPYLRKSRRDRLIATLLFGNDVERPEAALDPRLLDLGTRDLFPRAADDDYPLDGPGARLDLHDVTGIQEVEVGLDRLVGHDSGVLRTGEVGTHVGRTPHTQSAPTLVDLDDCHTGLLDRL